MARGFGNTQGVNNADVISCPNTTDPATKSFSIWTYRTGNGEGNFAYIFSKPNTDVTDSIIQLFYQVSNNTYNFLTLRDVTGPLNWRWTAGSANAWHHIGIIYDNTLNTNDPIIYMDNAVQSLTESGLSGVTATTSSQPFLLGQLGGEAGTYWWDGWLAEFSVWRVLLSADRVTQLAAGVPAAFVQPGDLLTYCPVWGITSPEYQFMKNIQKSTVTGTTAKAHPIVQAQGISCTAQAVGLGY